MRVVGYVIARDLDQKLFAGYKHPGTRATGYPVWTQQLDGWPAEDGKAAVYRSDVEATGVAVSIARQDSIPCTARPLYLDNNQTAGEDAWLAEVQDYLQQHEDVKDGDDGRPEPNTAMSLLAEMRRLGLAKRDD